MLTGEEKLAPQAVDETVPEGPVEPERTFLADPTVEPTGSDFPDAGQTLFDTEPELKHIEEVQRFEPRLSADPTLQGSSIQDSLIESFTEDNNELLPITADVEALPFGELLISALGRARSQEEVDRIKNSFYSGVYDFIPEGSPWSQHRNQVTAAVDTYFANLRPYVDFDDQNEFEAVVEIDPSIRTEEFKQSLKLIPGLTVVKREPEPVGYEEHYLTPESSDVEEDFDDEADEGKHDYSPIGSDWSEEESFQDIGDVVENTLEGDVLRLYQSQQGDSEQDAINYEDAYGDILDDFKAHLREEEPLDGKDEQDFKEVISSIPDRSLQSSMLNELEDEIAAQRYDQKELEDLPPHILAPHSLRLSGFSPSLKVRYGDYKVRGPSGTLGIDPTEVKEAERHMYTRSQKLTAKNQTVWIGPNGGEWVFNPGTKKFVNARRDPKKPGSLEGELVEYYRDSGKEIKPETRQISSIDDIIKRTDKNLRPNRSKRLGTIQVQWTTGQNQRDILVPSSAQFEDVVKLSEILRIEEGKIVDVDAKELLSIKKDTPLSAIISFFQTMLAHNAGHDLHLIFLPGKGRGSGLYLGGALMKLFAPPLVPHKEYHTTPGSRFKEYLSRLPLSTFSRHHRGGGLPGHGWNEPPPHTVQPYMFENAGAYPLPSRSFWDSDALDRDPKAMAKPFGSLPPGLGGPYGPDQRGIGGQIESRVQGWRVEPRGYGKRARGDPSGTAKPPGSLRTGGAKVSDVASGIAGVSGALAATGIGAVVAAPLAAVSGIVAGIGKIFGF